MALDKAGWTLTLPYPVNHRVTPVAKPPGDPSLWRQEYDPETHLPENPIIQDFLLRNPRDSVVDGSRRGKR